MDVAHLCGVLNILVKEICDLQVVVEAPDIMLLTIILLHRGDRSRDCVKGAIQELCDCLEYVSDK